MTYIPLKDLEVYQLCRKLSEIGWNVYEQLDWRDKKIIGDQFIEAIDSVGANVAEGYGRFHYLDRIKFCYNARGSLLEACDHWLELMKSRQKVSDKNYQVCQRIAQDLAPKLNHFINSLYKQKNKI